MRAYHRVNVRHVLALSSHRYIRQNRTSSLLRPQSLLKECYRVIDFQPRIRLALLNHAPILLAPSILGCHTHIYVLSSRTRVRQLKADESPSLRNHSVNADPIPRHIILDATEVEAKAEAERFRVRLFQRPDEIEASECFRFLEGW